MITIEQRSTQPDTFGMHSFRCVIEGEMHFLKARTAIGTLGFVAELLAEKEAQRAVGRRLDEQSDAVEQ